jgi:protein tyrosine/serine phosphatase
VLVHCWHGSDRTGIVVAAYRIVFQNWNVEEAEKEFRDERFGYHEFWYKNLLKLLRETDWDAMRTRIKGH